MKGSELLKNISNTLKTNITQIDKDDDKIKELSGGFLEIITLVRTRLIKSLTPVYGLLTSGTNITIDWYQKGFIDIKLTNPLTISFNPAYMEGIFTDDNFKLSYIMKQLAAESIRLIYRHPISFSKTNKMRDKKIHEMLEIASDVSMSEIINDSANKKVNEISLKSSFSAKPATTIIISSPENTITLDLLQDFYDPIILEKQSLEYYLGVLMMLDEPKLNELIQIRKNIKTNKELEEKHQNLKNISTPYNKIGTEIHNWEIIDNGKMNLLQLDFAIKDLLRSTYSRLGSMVNSGDGILHKISEEFLPPQKDWRDDILDTLTGSINTITELTRFKQDRRRPNNPIFYGRRIQSIGILYAVMDSSMSTCNEVIVYLSELRGICESMNIEIIVIECDTTIKNMYKIEQKHIKKESHGMGGTSFIEPIKFINNEPETLAKYEHFSEFVRNPRDTMAIYFTDGFCETGEVIPEPKCNKLIWAVTGNSENLQVKEPYGKIVEIKIEEKND